MSAVLYDATRQLFCQLHREFFRLDDDFLMCFFPPTLCLTSCTLYETTFPHLLLSLFQHVIGKFCVNSCYTRDVSFCVDTFSLCQNCFTTDTENSYLFVCVCVCVLKRV